MADFRFYQDQYGQMHRAYPGQPTRHILANDLFQHYGCNPHHYAQVMRDTNGSGNYRMGSVETNTRDRVIDNAITREVFGLNTRGGITNRGFDGDHMAQHGISHNQQLQALGTRFDHAKDMHARTGEYKYLMMQNDIRGIAMDGWNVDGRQWRTSRR